MKMRAKGHRFGTAGALAAFVLLLEGSAWAQKAPKMPDDLPAYGPLKPYVSPKVEVKTLENGMILWLVPRPGFPKVALALAVRGGFAEDPKELPGISEMLASTVTLGTKTLSAKQIADRIAAAGGELTGRADEDEIVVSAQVPSWKLGEGLGLLADVAQNAAFPADQVELEKKLLTEQLRGQEARSIVLARRELAKVVFGDSAYSVTMPTVEAVGKMDSQGLAAAYRLRFRPGQALLVAVGDFDAAELNKSIERAFGNWKNPAAAPIVTASAPQREMAHKIFFIDRPNSVQTTMLLGRMGVTEHDPQYAAFRVSTTLMGGMGSARMGSNIRENKGYSYGAGSDLETYAGGAEVFSGANVRNAVTGAAFNEFLYELNRMATTTPRAGELERAQRHIIGSQALGLQSQMELANQFCGLWVKQLDPDALEKEDAEILKVTVEDVAKIGEEYLPAYKQAVVMVGDKKVITEQMAPFNLEIEAVR
jgi:zinc protease